MKHFLSLFVLFLSITSFCSGQSERAFFFNSPVFEFGTILEEKGPVTHDFYFTNETQDSVQVTSVKSSCGCTTPEWPKEKIGPGEEGLIKVRFDPKSRPGGFRKSITVINSLDEVYTLNIKGYVQAEDESVEDRYPYDLGALKFSTRAINFGTVKTYFDNDSIASTLKKTELIKLYNPGTDDVEITQIITPDHIQISQDTITLKADSALRLEVDYLPQFQKSLGYRSDNISFRTNHPEDSVMELYTFASVEEYFPRLTPRERSLAPKLSIEEAVFDFKDIEEADTLSTEIKLVNKGASPLKIRAIRSNCNCLKAKLEKSKLESKEEAVLSVVFIPGKRKGIQHKSVTIFSNDPLNPSQLVTVKATVR